MVVVCLWVDVLVVETTEIEAKDKTHTTLFRKSCTNSLISYRIVVAYKKPIIEALFHLSIYILTPAQGEV